MDGNITHRHSHQVPGRRWRQWHEAGTRSPTNMCGVAYMSNDTHPRNKHSSDACAITGEGEDTGNRQYSTERPKTSSPHTNHVRQPLEWMLTKPLLVTFVTVCSRPVSETLILNSDFHPAMTCPPYYHSGSIHSSRLNVNFWMWPLIASSLPGIMAWNQPGCYEPVVQTLRSVSCLTDGHS